MWSQTLLCVSSYFPPHRTSSFFHSLSHIHPHTTNTHSCTHTGSVCRGIWSTGEVRTRRAALRWRRAWAPGDWRWTWTLPATCRASWASAMSLPRPKSWWKAWATTVSQTSDHHKGALRQETKLMLNTVWWNTHWCALAQELPLSMFRSAVVVNSDSALLCIFTQLALHHNRLSLKLWQCVCTETLYMTLNFSLNLF